MSNEINHNIMNENVIDREELIEYLTYILDTDCELDKFYDRENLREEEDDPVPDVLAFRDWLEGQTFSNIIRDIYFEDYIKEYFQDIGQYDPDYLLHEHINWQDVFQNALDNDYERVFEWNDDDDHLHPYNIWGDVFYYHI